VSTSGSRCACAPAGREELRTEISAKFTPARLASDLEAAGLRLVRTLTDDQDRFALTLATPA
jgi:L-histidine N-alpha-methyltransferase